MARFYIEYLSTSRKPNSGFIDLIDHGDQIMADRGFLVKEEIMIQRGTLIIPPPAQGAEQMSSVNPLQCCVSCSPTM
jgi:hypothetical protein